MYKKILASVFLFCFSFSIYAQKFTISGYVKDAKTGEFLFGANAYLKENMKGAQTNQYGYYALSADKSSYTFVVSYMGYEEYSKPVELNQNLKINVELSEKVITTKEVVITDQKADKNTTSTDMGTVNLEVEKIKSLPAFMGEVDILKTIQLTPGVQNAGEGSSSFYVRGGGPDQNLILLDEAVVYNASHLFGFFSVFNADAVKNIELTKAGMPANYGGRLASVLDISMKEGNTRDYHVDGGIGLISSRLTVQGPIKKDTSSFIISGRRTYADLIIIKPFVKKTSAFKGSGYYFYDLNTKINYRFTDKDRLFISGYFGRDIFSMKERDMSFQNSISWGNATGCMRWNHVFGPKLFLNTSFILSDYQFEMGVTQSEYDMKLFSGVTDYTTKFDFYSFPSTQHKLKFGGMYIYHIFTPNNASAKTSGVELDLGPEVRLYSNEAAVYINDEFDLTDKLKLNGGFRYTFFQAIGPFTRYIKNQSGTTTDSICYDRWENVKMYNHIEPRISLRYTLDEVSSIKASYNQNYQYIHLASFTAVSLPTDIWVPCSEIVKPQFGTQYSLGYFRNFKKNMFETSLEVYYKEMENQIEMKETSTPEDNIKNNTDNNFTFGKGWSYGAEFFINKRLGQWTGWIGYTHSYTKRKFPEINQGEEFWAKYDRRHDISVIVSYEMNDRWTFSAIWIYATGNAMTLPIARYIINGNIVNEYGPRNDFRMPPYHRMDVSATLKGKKHKKYESSWNFSIYNVYNRYNPYYIYFDTEGNVADFHLETKAKQVSLFPILPSVTWNFKF